MKDCLDTRLFDIVEGTQVWESLILAVKEIYLAVEEIPGLCSAVSMERSFEVFLT